MADYENKDKNVEDKVNSIDNDNLSRDADGDRKKNLAFSFDKFLNSLSMNRKKKEENEELSELFEKELNFDKDEDRLDDIMDSGKSPFENRNNPFTSDSLFEETKEQPKEEKIYRSWNDSPEHYSLSEKLPPIEEIEAEEEVEVAEPSGDNLFDIGASLEQELPEEDTDFEAQDFQAEQTNEEQEDIADVFGLDELDEIYPKDEIEEIEAEEFVESDAEEDFEDGEILVDPAMDYDVDEEAELEDEDLEELQELHDTDDIKNIDDIVDIYDEVMDEAKVIEQVEPEDEEFEAAGLDEEDTEYEDLYDEELDEALVEEVSDDDDDDFELDFDLDDLDLEEEDENVFASTSTEDDIFDAVEEDEDLDDFADIDDFDEEDEVTEEATMYGDGNLFLDEEVEDTRDDEEYTFAEIPSIEEKHPSVDDEYKNDRGEMDFDKIVGETKLMTIDSIYSCKNLAKKVSESVFMIELYSKTLPENLPEDVKRQSVLNILKVSSLEVDNLLQDAYNRIDVLNEVLEDVAQKTDEMNMTNEREIYELNEKIKELMQRMEKRAKYQQTQNTSIGYEIQRIINIVEFINPK